VIAGLNSEDFKASNSTSRATPSPVYTADNRFGSGTDSRPFSGNNRRIKIPAETNTYGDKIVLRDRHSTPKQGASQQIVKNARNSGYANALGVAETKSSFIQII